MYPHVHVPVVPCPSEGFFQHEILDPCIFMETKYNRVSAPVFELNLNSLVLLYWYDEILLDLAVQFEYVFFIISNKMYNI